MSIYRQVLMMSYTTRGPEYIKQHKKITVPEGVNFL